MSVNVGRPEQVMRLLFGSALGFTLSAVIPSVLANLHGGQLCATKTAEA
jgi:hypothetical protein